VAVTTTATFNVSLNATTTQSTALTIRPPSPISIQLAPTIVFGGSQSTVTVVLNGPAPAGGLPLTITSSFPLKILNPVVVPASVDRISIPFATSAVTQAQSVTISAAPTAVREAAQRTSSIADGASSTVAIGELGGGGQVSASLTIEPLPQLQTLAASSASVTGGDSLALLLNWTGAGGLVARAQVSTSPAGLVLMPLSLALTAPSTLSPVANTTVVPVRTAIPNAQTVNVTVTATLGTQSVSTTFAVQKPIPPIASVSIRPNSISGGNVIMQVTLDPAIAAPVVVNVSTDHPEIVNVPPTISLSPSAVPTPFTFTTTKPSAHTVVTITLSARGQTIATTLNANP
jgi:hypothetical protein